jgi:hypothetical protein
MAHHPVDELTTGPGQWFTQNTTEKERPAAIQPEVDICPHE